MKFFFAINDKSWEYILRIAKKLYLKPCFFFRVFASALLPLMSRDFPLEGYIFLNSSPKKEEGNFSTKILKYTILYYAFERMDPNSTFSTTLCILFLFLL